MRPHLVVIPAPILDHDLGFEAITEPLHRQAFVAEFTVEALVRAALPQLAGIDQYSLKPLFLNPLPMKPDT